MTAVATAAFRPRDRSFMWTTRPGRGRRQQGSQARAKPGDATMSGGFSFPSGRLEWVQRSGGGSQALRGEGDYMDYTQAFAAALQALKDEGRYRVFADIRRDAGHFPAARHFRRDGDSRPITVWCSNDYLGMGQSPVVLAAMHAAIDVAGAGSGGTRNISGTTHYHVELEDELADLHKKEAALLFTSAYVANDTTLATLRKLLPDLVIFSDANNHASMIAGIRNGGGEK